MIGEGNGHRPDYAAGGPRKARHDGQQLSHREVRLLGQHREVRFWGQHRAAHQPMRDGPQQIKPDGVLELKCSGQSLAGQIASIDGLPMCRRLADLAVPVRVLGSTPPAAQE
jgi:hypothetical protein